jgi:hypothetical protein
LTVIAPSVGDPTMSQTAGRSTSREAAIQIDLGDITLCLTARVKGLRPPRFVWRMGPVRDTVPADRIAGPRPPYKQPPGKVDLIVDLHADKKVSFSLQAIDEMGNPTTFDGTIAYSVDDPSIVALTDNGDGSGVAAAVGPLGTAVLTATITPTTGAVVEKSEAINVIAGDAASFSFTFGPEEEVTPDDVP